MKDAVTADREEKYLFIICMNNSGSTLLERVIRSCRNIVTLPAGPDQQVNGQGFVLNFMPTPGQMQPPCTRIFSEKAAVLENETLYQWHKIIQVWRLEWAKNPKFDTAIPRVFLEKSPANVYRAAMLQKYFPNSFFLLAMRNPYAVAEGVRRRMGYSIQRCIQHWIHCARKQMENERTLGNWRRVSYEQLSEDRDFCRRQILELIPELDDLDMNQEVVVHSVEGNIRRGLVNYNADQIGKLSADDFRTINSYLDQAPDTMGHFGYQRIESAGVPVA